MHGKSLFILWTSDNKDTVMNMLLMYTLKAQTMNWWDRIEIASWGASNSLVCSDTDVEDLVKEIKLAGANLYACQRCAERNGLVNQLQSIGFEVKYMGEPLTKRLQDDKWEVITI